MASSLGCESSSRSYHSSGNYSRSSGGSDGPSFFGCLTLLLLLFLVGYGVKSAYNKLMGKAEAPPVATASSGEPSTVTPAAPDAGSTKTPSPANAAPATNGNPTTAVNSPPSDAEVIATSNPPTDAETSYASREWQNRAGRKIQAVFVSYRDGKVTVRVPTGKEFLISLADLSAADCQYVLEQMAALGPASPLTARKWADKTGAFTIQAAYLTKSDDTVTLLKPDGNLVTVPLQRLSDTDQELVSKF